MSEVIVVEFGIQVDDPFLLEARHFLSHGFAMTATLLGSHDSLIWRRSARARCIWNTAELSTTLTRALTIVRGLGVVLATAVLGATQCRVNIFRGKTTVTRVSARARGRLTLNCSIRSSKCKFRRGRTYSRDLSLG